MFDLSSLTNTHPFNTNTGYTVNEHWLYCVCAESNELHVSVVFWVCFFLLLFICLVLPHTHPVCVCMPDVPLALNANGETCPLHHPVERSSTALIDICMTVSLRWPRNVNLSLFRSREEGPMIRCHQEIVLLVRNLPPSTFPHDSSNFFCAA